MFCPAWKTHAETHCTHKSNILWCLNSHWSRVKGQLRNQSVSWKEKEAGAVARVVFSFIYFFSRTLLWDCKQLQPRCGWFYQKWTIFPHGKQSKEQRQRIPLTAAAAAAPQQLVAHHSTSSVLIQSRLCLCASQPSTGGSPVLLGGCCRGGGSSALRQQQQVTAGGWLWSSRVAGSLFRTPSPVDAAPGVESSSLFCPSLDVSLFDWPLQSAAFWKVTETPTLTPFKGWHR